MLVVWKGHSTAVGLFDLFLAVRRGHRRLRGKGRGIAMWGMILRINIYISNTHGTQAQREQPVPLGHNASAPANAPAGSLRGSERSGLKRRMKFAHYHAYDELKY